MSEQERYHDPNGYLEDDPPVEFTPEMRKTHTILVPMMLPIHFEMLETILGRHGYRVEVLRTTGAKLILVTRYAHSPAAEHADVVLLCGAEEQPLQYGSVDSTISQLYIIDVLISRYRLMNMDQVDRYREFIAKVLARKHL